MPFPRPRGANRVKIAWGIAQICLKNSSKIHSCSSGVHHLHLSSYAFSKDLGSSSFLGSLLRHRAVQNLYLRQQWHWQCFCCYSASPYHQLWVSWKIKIIWWIIMILQTLLFSTGQPDDHHCLHNSLLPPGHPSYWVFKGHLKRELHFERSHEVELHSPDDGWHRSIDDQRSFR